MARIHVSLPKFKLVGELNDFLFFLRRYIRLRGYRWFSSFEGGKDVIVDLLYRQRGKYARPFLHFGTIALVFLVITFGPFIIQNAQDDSDQNASRGILQVANAYGDSFTTNQAEEVKQFRGGELTTYTVQSGDTLSSVASKYGLKATTIEWANNLDDNAQLKPGQQLTILPVDGIRHQVQRGETIYTIAKKYGLPDDAGAQPIIDYPFNEFLNDETFELAVGSYIMVPGGVQPAPEQQEAPTIALQKTPDAGTVTATGTFVWPASGIITQPFSFYHSGVDIANHAGGPILAADAGTVIVTGWDTTGYGNKIMIDHGNGYVTLYGHLSLIQVSPGQRVNRGDVIGQMGSTGHSTGTHLHFEVRKGGVPQNPLNYLK